MEEEKLYVGRSYGTTVYAYAKTKKEAKEKIQKAVGYDPKEKRDKGYYTELITGIDVATGNNLEIIKEIMKLTKNRVLRMEDTLNSKLFKIPMWEKYFRGKFVFEWDEKTIKEFNEKIKTMENYTTIVRQLKNLLRCIGEVE